VSAFPGEYVNAALETCHGKLKIFSELPHYAGFYFSDELTPDPEAAVRVFSPENKPRLERFRQVLGELGSFDATTIETALKETAKDLGVKPAILVHPVRLACTGNTAGPSLYHLLGILGKERVLARIDRALGNWN
jgi:glutamyl-tRNA synthetase